MYRLCFLLICSGLLLLTGCGPRVVPTDDDDSAATGDPNDNDGDGFCPASVSDEDCEDADKEPGDCDDDEPTVYPEAEELCDALDNDCNDAVDEPFDSDVDGYVSQTGAGCSSAYPAEELDCNDFNALVFPGSPEECDGVDNDCNGEVDDGLDNDSDGFQSCGNPRDCDDEEADAFPGNPEACDEIDNDCDGIVDNGVGGDFTDADFDGQTPCQGDCDDADASVFEGNVEGCDEIDNDCDGDVDEDTDVDGDGVPGPFPNCFAVAGAIDCDDNDPALYPGAPEVCDFADNDCDGTADENLDFDSDGFTSCEGDCQALNAAVNPSAVEVCDGLDNDCNNVIDDNFDNDGDGQSPCSGDCDDANAVIFDGAPELCDDLDNDCDGLLGVNEADQDGDGFSACQGDCDEADVGRNPAMLEICNAIDDDCDGALPADEQDNDLDGFITCTPPGCEIGLINDGDDATFFDAFTGLDALNLDLDVFTDNETLLWTEDESNFEGQVLVWYSGNRDISGAELAAMESWLQGGGGLVVTGPDLLSDGDVLGDDDDSAAGDDDDSAAGDDDDSAGDDDDSAGDDDDSAGDDDDSAGDDDDSAGPAGPSFGGNHGPVHGDNMATLIRSLTVGAGPQSDVCAISNASTVVTDGPWITLNTGHSFDASSTNHEFAVADTSRGAVRVASVGSRAKILYTPVFGGGAVLFWNGNEDLGDWDDGFDADLPAMLRNAVWDMNAACAGSLVGGDCDDTDATLVPGTCP